MKVYYIWGPKYIGGELNGPDLIAGAVLTDNKQLVMRGRNPELMLGDFSLDEVKKLNKKDAEKLFHLIVTKSIPASLQVVFSNASYEESSEFIQSLDA